MNIHAKNIFWVYFFTFAAMPLGYLIRVLYAQNLSLEDYGVFYGLFGFFAFFEVLRNWGMPQAINFFANKYLYLAKKDLPKTKTLFLFAHIFRFLCSCLIVGGIFLFKDYILNTFYPTEKNAELIFTVFILFWGVQSFAMINSNYLSIFQNQKINGFLEFLKLSLILGFSFIFFGKYENYLVPVYVYLGVQILITIIGFIYLFIKYPSYLLKPTIIYTKPLFVKVLKYATAFISINLGNTIFVATDTMMLQYFKGAKEVAYYSTAVATASLLLVLMTPLQKVISPLIAKLWHTGNKKTISKLLSDFINHVFILLLPLAFFVALFSKNIILAVFGTDFSESIILLSILSVVIFLKGFRMIFSSALGAIGRPDSLHKVVYGVGIFNLVMNLILIYFWGALGVVISTAISFVLFFIFLLKELRKEIPIYLDGIYILKTTVISICFVTFAYFLKETIYLDVFNKTLWNFVLNGGIIFTLASAFYVFLLFFTRTITRQKIVILKELLLNDNN